MANFNQILKKSYHRAQMKQIFVDTVGIINTIILA